MARFNVDRTGARRRVAIAIQFAAIGFSTLLGCGQAPPQGIVVSGTVTVRDISLANGMLTLKPAKGLSGPAISANVEAGKFNFDAAQNVRGGNYRVVVVSFGQEDIAVQKAKAAPATQQGAVQTWETPLTIPPQEAFECHLEF